MLAESKTERMERVVMVMISSQGTVLDVRAERVLAANLAASHSLVELDAGAATIATCYHW
jgi:hypothetical protein